MSRVAPGTRTERGQIISLFPRTPPGEDADALVERAKEVLAEDGRTTRTLAAELSPAVLESDRLSVVLEWLAASKRAKHGMTVEVEVRGELSVADPALRILLYKVLREVLFNVLKHSGGTHARLAAWEDGGEVVVEVADDGAGFDVGARAERPGGFGLSSVRERLELVGGRFAIASAPGAGTRVTVAVPLCPE